VGDLNETCRESCSRAGEPLAGSAGAAADWVGIEWPKPRWHDDRASLSEGLPPALAELEDARENAGQKLALRVFQRAPRVRASGVEVVAFRASGRGFRALDVPLERVAPVLADWLASGSPPPGSEPLGPEIFVCTDGRHDRCCAVHGRPVHAALAAEVARRGLAVGVAEVSHLGGHRFAANCLALPGGHLYGRVEPADAPALVDAVLAGRVLAARSRGRLGTPELAQVAEAFLREQFPDLVRCEVETPAAKPAGDVVRVAAVVQRAAVEQKLELELRRESFELSASCGDDRRPTSRWIATRLL
jgi:hypothetical protein